jgi:hypothetical protein
MNLRKQFYTKMPQYIFRISNFFIMCLLVYFSGPAVAFAYIGAELILSSIIWEMGFFFYRRNKKNILTTIFEEINTELSTDKSLL